jgi:hypothetical protein
MMLMHNHLITWRTKPDTPALDDRLVHYVRRRMTDPGFALVKTPPFFDDGSLLRLKRSETLLPPDAKRWSRFPRLARYARWLGDLLAEALPEEPVCLAALEFRHEPPGLENLEVDRLHADAGYIRSAHTLYGAATVYRDHKVEWSVPRGQTLLMTAQDRTRTIGPSCTLHRRPNPGGERAVLVCSLVPRKWEPKGSGCKRR